MQKLKSMCGLITLAGIALVALNSDLAGTGTDAGAAPAPASTAPAAQSGAKVEIDNVSFTPSELTVNVGTKVTWTNHDDIPHTATAKGKPPAFDSETLDTDGKFSFTFDQPGIYAYYCKLHPQNRKIYRQITRFRAFDAKQRRVFCTAVRRRLDRARCRIAQTLVAVIFSCSHNSAV